MSDPASTGPLFASDQFISAMLGAIVGGVLAVIGSIIGSYFARIAEFQFQTLIRVSDLAREYVSLARHVAMDAPAGFDPQTYLGNPPPLDPFPPLDVLREQSFSKAYSRYLSVAADFRTTSKRIRNSDVQLAAEQVLNAGDVSRYNEIGPPQVYGALLKETLEAEPRLHATINPYLQGSLRRLIFPGRSWFWPFFCAVLLFATLLISIACIGSRFAVG